MKTWLLAQEVFVFLLITGDSMLFSPFILSGGELTVRQTFSTAKYLSSQKKKNNLDHCFILYKSSINLVAKHDVMFITEQK